MTDRLTAQQLDEIAARADAATRGPWGFYDGDNYADVAADLEQTSRGSCSYREKVARLEDENYWDDPAHEDDDEERAPEQMAANAAFIAHAREDVPALLAELSVVRAERDSAHAEVEQLRSSRWDATKVVADLESRLHATHSELADVLGVLARLASPEACRWEGVYCITHSWRSDTGSCPHGEAQQLLGGAA